MRSWDEQPGTRLPELTVGMTSPRISEAICGVAGTPSAKLVMRPNCHPPSTRPRNPPGDLSAGTFQSELITRLRLTSKADSPLFNFRSYHGSLTASSWNVSPAVLPDASSMLLLYVKEPCT